MLSDSEASEVESLHHLTINEHYAKAFQYKKEREEFQKLKDKYGSDLGEDEENLTTDSESDESEDENGEELTPTMDAAIFRTLARIKRKDPEIYDTNKGIFNDEQKKVTPMQTSRALKDKSRPVTVRQVALESALNLHSRSPSPELPPHVEEQRALRAETVAAFHQAVDDQDNGGLFVPREKTKDEQGREEEEYKAFLKREVGGDLKSLVTIDANDEAADNSTTYEAEYVKKTQTSKNKKNRVVKVTQDESHRNAKQDSDQEFLMNYIVNRGWIDRSANHIPTYSEVLSSKTKVKHKAEQRMSSTDSETGPADKGDQTLLSMCPELDDDDFEEIVDRFESSYNFRFEEPDAAVIKSYPRNLPSLVRRENTSRKEARERRKQRKEEELVKKKEEVKLLKKLKMKEINAKLERIGREGGKDLQKNLEVLQSLDLDGEWDRAEHDRQMAELYENDKADDKKPRWDEDIDIDDIVPVYKGPSQKSTKKKKMKKYDEDEAGELGVDVDAMNADVNREVDDNDDGWDGTEEMRKKRLDEYMDEIYGLDFSDMVGDLPTRFKYVPVQPQNYSLTPVEILTATDQELNEYMSVTKYAPYRREARWDSKRLERLKEFRNKFSERMAISGAGEATDAADKSTKKRKGKKERSKLKTAVVEENPNPETKVGALKRRQGYENEGDLAGNVQEPETHGKQKRRRRKTEPQATEV